MYEVLKDHMEIVELAEAAMKGAGIASLPIPPSAAARTAVC